jgi:GDPmannose 4,6-dehydratase
VRPGRYGAPQPVPSQRALIIGAAGQDGSLLSELLLAEGYEVFGVVRQPASTRFENLAAIRDQLELFQADVLDELSLVDVLTSVRPHEVYNLASPSFVPMSWRQPVLTAEFAAVGVTALLESIRRVDDGIRFYQASSSEIFGEPREVPQTEETALAPVTPYGVAKAYAHFITRSYRRHYGLHASSGILYNHESPRRPLDFVTRKVCHAAAAVSLELEEEVELGNLDARRDWGFAGDYVRAMWLMLQQDEPDDYVIATGKAHSVRELVELAFSHLDLDPDAHVRTDPAYFRPAEVDHLIGDASKAREKLGWEPRTSFEELVRLMVDADLELLSTRAPQRQA